MRTEFDSELETRLVRYAAIDTQSDEDSPTSPSTAIQLDLARVLKTELEEIGASDVQLTDYGAVLATIPATELIDSSCRSIPLRYQTMPVSLRRRLASRA